VAGGLSMILYKFNFSQASQMIQVCNLACSFFVSKSDDTHLNKMGVKIAAPLLL
jgi:hypothetical protein